MQVSMLVVTGLSPAPPFYFLPKASQQFSVELIYDISTKLEVEKLLSFEKIIWSLGG